MTDIEISKDDRSSESEGGALTSAITSEYLPKKSTETTITTFYSFKGGVGRSLALHAVANIMASRLRKVLILDVDLEAPGLSTAFLDENERTSKDGFFEIVSQLSDAIFNSAKKGKRLPKNFIKKYSVWFTESLHDISWAQNKEQETFFKRLKEIFPEHKRLQSETGSIFLLSCGKIYKDYASFSLNFGNLFDFKVSDDNLPEDEKKERFENAMKMIGSIDIPEGNEIPENLGQVLIFLLRKIILSTISPDGQDFDYILVDSRAGLADIGGLCVRGLADNLVMVSGLNKQNLFGNKMVLDTLSSRLKTPEHLLTVISPVPEGEIDLVSERMKEAKEILNPSSPFVLIHYHPRLALLEDPFVTDIYKYSRPWDDYRKLCSRIQQWKHEDVSSYISKHLSMIREFSDKDIPEIIYNIMEICLNSKKEGFDVVNTLTSSLSESNVYKENWLPLFRLESAIKPEDLFSSVKLAIQLNRTGKSIFKNGLEKGHILIDQSMLQFEKTLSLETKKERTYLVWASAISDWAKVAPEDEREVLFQSAFEKFENALEIDPKDAAAYYNWGNALSNWAKTAPEAERESLYKSAFEKYEKSLEIDPKYAAAYNNWGSALSNWAKTAPEAERESLYKSAFEKYEKALEIDPKDTAAYNNWGLALSNWAEVAPENERESLYKSAFEKYEKVLEIDPKYAAAYNNWGLALSNWAEVAPEDERESLFKSAFEKFEKAVEIDPKYAAAYGNWSTAIVGMWHITHDPSLLEDGRKKCEKANEIEKDSESYNLACIYSLDGNTDGALKWLGRAIKKDKKYIHLACKDDDFESIRYHPKFKKLVGLK